MSQTNTWDIHIQTGEEICQWITTQGGWEALTTADVLYIMQARLGTQNPGFIVTTTHVLGVMYYRLGNGSLGNQSTGCVFT